MDNYSQIVGKIKIVGKKPIKNYYLANKFNQIYYPDKSQFCDFTQKTILLCNISHGIIFDIEQIFFPIMWSIIHKSVNGKNLTLHRVHQPVLCVTVVMDDMIKLNDSELQIVMKYRI